MGSVSQGLERVVYKEGRPDHCFQRGDRALVAVYGLGLIGAFVWFWTQARDGHERAIAALKAVVWPAFLVHDAFKALRD